eukprot:jgi/Botrbrau1/2861/Bobra.0036s0007.1
MAHPVRLARTKALEEANSGISWPGPLSPSSAARHKRPELSGEKLPEKILARAPVAYNKPAEETGPAGAVALNG